MPVVYDERKHPRDRLGRFRTKHKFDVGASPETFRIPSAEEADAQYQPWRDGLSEEQRQTVGTYAESTEAAEQMNAFMRRGESDSPEVRQLSRDLSDALEDSEIQENTVVYRDLGDPSLVELARDGNLVGAEITDNGFMSTTLDPSFAGIMGADAEPLDPGFEGDRILDVPPKVPFIRATIRVPKGAHGAYLGELSPYPDEQELLLQSGTTTRVTGAKLSRGATGLGTLYISMDVVEQLGGSGDNEKDNGEVFGEVRPEGAEGQDESDPTQLEGDDLYRYMTGEEMPEDPREAMDVLANNLDFDKLANVDGDAYNALYDRLEAGSQEREAAGVAREQEERGAEIRAAAQGPVSNAFNVKDLPRHMAEDVAGVLDAIDGVHSDGELDAVPLEANSEMSAEGEHVIAAGTGEPKIRLNPGADSLPLTAVHEIGHLLDRGVLATDKDGFASESNSPLVERWRDATLSSKAAKQLKEMMLTDEDTIGEFTRDRNYLAYLNRENELFARSYAQYIAQRSGNAELQRGVDQRRQSNPWELHYPTQWEDDDFEPIAAAFDEMFAERGWR